MTMRTNIARAVFNARHVGVKTVEFDKLPDSQKRVYFADVDAALDALVDISPAVFDVLWCGYASHYGGGKDDCAAMWKEAIQAIKDGK